MRQPAHGTTGLPKQILRELGISVDTVSGVQRINRKATRKEQRKAARIETRTSQVVVKKKSLLDSKRYVSHKGESLSPPVNERKVRTSVELKLQSPKSTPKASKKTSHGAVKGRREYSRSMSPDSKPKINTKVRSQLAEDDAEIEALEKVLGMKDRKTPSRSFEEDGLQSVLDGLDSADPLASAALGKRKRTEEYLWLERKRHKAQAHQQDHLQSEEESSSGSEGFNSNEDYSNYDSKDVDSDSRDTDDLSSVGELAEEYPERTKAVAQVRENPYVAPVTGPAGNLTSRYVPPSFKITSSGASENLSQLRRQLQGLLNRLSEAKLLSIVGDVEKLYQNNARQHVTHTLIALLMGLLSDPTTLHDTFIILHAGFIAALFKVLGNDFGAQMIASLDEEFIRHHHDLPHYDTKGKNAANLMGLIAQLYVFQVVGSDLVYDYVRVYLDELSEYNTELLLRIIRVAGQQLRQDDSFALKDIAAQLHGAVVRAAGKHLSVRTKFMIETINNMKDKKAKTGIAAASIFSEHTAAMKKSLGALNQRNLKSTAPLRIGLGDIRDSQRRGKWWLVVACYGDSHHGRAASSTDLQREPRIESRIENGDLAELAMEQRMNTDVRRSIFVAIMSATDYNDAYVRLLKLRLKKSQELEIPKVLIHCAGAESVYNPYYTLLSRRVCSDRKLRMAFQFSLWDLFKQLGESNVEDDADENHDTDKTPELRSIVNIARMFGILIAEGGLSLAVLKSLNLAYLQSKTRVFVELLLITLITQSQKSSGGSRDEKPLLDIFLQPKEMTEMASSLRYFLKKVVSRSDIGSPQDRETVKWGCKVARDALAALSTGTVVNS